MPWAGVGCPFGARGCGTVAARVGIGIGIGIEFEFEFEFEFEKSDPDPDPDPEQGPLLPRGGDVLIALENPSERR